MKLLCLVSSAGQVLLETVPASAVLSVLQSWSGGAVGVVGAERGLFIDFDGLSCIFIDFRAWNLTTVRSDLLPL